MIARRFFVPFIILFSLHAVAEPVCITSARAKLHSGPGKNYPVSWLVGQHMPLLRIAKKGSWSQVKDLDGEVHWVSTSAISTNISCAVVKTKTAKLLKGPGSQFPPAEYASVEKYTPFRKVDRDGEWLQVRDEYQGEYWINESNLWMPVVRSKIAF